MKALIKRSFQFGTLSALMLIAQAVAAQTTIDFEMVVDNGYDVYISASASDPGTLIGPGTGYPTPDTWSAPLFPGVTNYLHVVGANSGTPSAANPGAFLGEFSLSDANFYFFNGTQALLTSAEPADGWVAGAVPPGPPALDVPVKLADHGDAPWGVIGTISPDADWIWLDAIGDAQTPTVLFTAAILPVFDVEITVVDDPLLAYRQPSLMPSFLWEPILQISPYRPRPDH